MKQKIILPAETTTGDWKPILPNKEAGFTLSPDGASKSDPKKFEVGKFKFHGLFENRTQERISQRELGLVQMSMRQPGREEWIAVRLWDFTSISFGVQFLPPQSIQDPAGFQRPEAGSPTEPADERDRLELGSLPADSGKVQVQCGDQVEIRIRITHHAEFQIWCEVKNTVAWKDGVKIGLRRLDIAFPQSVNKERRENFRLPVAPALALNARLSHPFLFGQWSLMQVSDVNHSMGLSFDCRDPSILVFEDMELDIHFELPNLRQVAMSARVAWVHATEANHVKFGVACLDMPWALHNGICDFLLFSRHWTPLRLREAGFRARRVKNRLRFRTVKNMGDYAEVLYLRRDAYVGAGKKSADTKPEEMAGSLDGCSRILMAHHHNDLVGSLTFTFPPTEDTVLDSQAGFPGKKYPVALPPKANLIEVSRLCIHGEYRNTDLLQGLFEHGIKHFLMSDRHWLLTSAVEGLLPAYLRIGFVRLKASYRHPGLNHQEHHLILAHRNTFLWGQGMNLMVWNTLFSDVIAYMLDRKLIEVNGLERAIIRSKLLLRPVSRLFVERRAQSAFQAHLKSLRESFRHRPGKETVPEAEMLPTPLRAPSTPESPRDSSD